MNNINTQRINCRSDSNGAQQQQDKTRSGPSGRLAALDGSSEPLIGCLVLGQRVGFVIVSTLLTVPPVCGIGGGGGWGSKGI